MYTVSKMFKIKIKKHIIISLISILIVVLWLGYFHTNKTYVLWHFNKYQQSYENIVCYSKSMTNGFEIDKDEYLFNSQEYPEISEDLRNIFVQGNYYSIWGKSVITFQVFSLYTPKEGVYALVYSDNPMENQVFYDNHERPKREIVYEPLGDNWYIEYRK